MKNTDKKEFLQFLLVGGIAAAVNFVTRIAFSEFVSFRVSIVLAYLVGMITAFILSKLYVFDVSGRHYLQELKDFSIVNIFAVIQVWIISVGLAEFLLPAIHYTFYPEELAHITGLMIPAITSYFGHKYFSFRKV